MEQSRHGLKCQHTKIDSTGLCLTVFQISELVVVAHSMAKEKRGGKTLAKQPLTLLVTTESNNFSLYCFCCCNHEH